jgi:hypothetical protein
MVNSRNTAVCQSRIGSGRGGAAGESTGAGIGVVARSEALTTSRLM